jgi:hypothetical protein
VPYFVPLSRYHVAELPFTNFISQSWRKINQINKNFSKDNNLLGGKFYLFTKISMELWSLIFYHVTILNYCRNVHGSISKNMTFACTHIIVVRWSKQVDKFKRNRQYHVFWNASSEFIFMSAFYSNNIHESWVVWFCKLKITLHE